MTLILHGSVSCQNHTCRGRVGENRHPTLCLCLGEKAVQPPGQGISQVRAMLSERDSECVLIIQEVDADRWQGI